MKNSILCALTAVAIACLSGCANPPNLGVARTTSPEWQTASVEYLRVSMAEIPFAAFAELGNEATKQLTENGGVGLSLDQTAMLMSHSVNTSANIVENESTLTVDWTKQVTSAAGAPIDVGLSVKVTPIASPYRRLVKASIVTLETRQEEADYHAVRREIAMDGSPLGQPAAFPVGKEKTVLIVQITPARGIQ